MPQGRTIVGQPHRRDTPWMPCRRRGHRGRDGYCLRVAIAVGANRSHWTSGATGILVALLILSTIVTGKVIVDLRRAPRLQSPNRTDNSSDWLTDLITVAKRESRWLGPLRRPGLLVLAWVKRTFVREIRRHPLVAAALSSGAFGVTVFGYQAVREGYSLSVMLLTMSLGTCGMFAFLVLAGSYLGVVRPQRR